MRKYLFDPIFKIIGGRNTKKSMYYGAAMIVILVVLVAIFSRPPSDFPQKKIVAIPRNSYMSQSADRLYEGNIIRSKFLFKLYVVLLSGHRHVQAGDYLFDTPESSLQIAYRLSHGEQNLPKISITLYEGMTVKEMATQIKKNIPSFDDVTFYNIAKSYEGYVFPDTYFFYENVTPAQVLATLRDNFSDKIKTALLDIQAFGKPMADVITMASIVEREATNAVDRKIIAGILWRRLAIGMPLQVDPPFYYLLGKGSLELTTKDLALNSPYNLYKNKGLTPTPISNPGLDTILDTVNPTKTDYLFFLADKKGVIHYATNNEGHSANKQKYLQ